uniref:Wsv025 n=1 Tax=Caenorhabditis tropicalis TaxID=1561998 RepID=A0A1I7T7C0_9PELO
MGTSPPPSPPLPIETSDASTNTDEPYIPLDSLQPILTESIAKHLRKPDIPVVSVPVEDPKPSMIAQTNSSTFNMIPRTSRLKDLDKMIRQKEELLERMNSEIEVKRKILMVREARERRDKKLMKEEKKKREEEKRKKEDVKDPEEDPEEAPEDVEEKEEEVEESESESTSTSSESSSPDSTSSEPTSSSPSSQETVRAAPTKESDGESTIEDPFSARQDPPEAEDDDPAVTRYLENLQKRVMEDMQRKYI